MMNYLALSILMLLAVFIFHRRHARKGNTLPLPPGPKPLAIVGNITDLPPPGIPEYQHWAKFKDLYGPINSVSVFGSVFVIIHDRQIAKDVLEKKSTITSERTSFPFASEMCEYKKFSVFQPFDDSYKRQRKLIQRQLGSRASAATFNHVQDAESRRLLVHILEEPTKLVDHFQLETAAIILKITYGYSVDQHKADPFVTLVKRMMSNLTLAAVPLTWGVDIIPALKYLPEWFPGSSFKKTARSWRTTLNAAIDAPYSFACRGIVAQPGRSSFTASAINHVNQSIDGSIVLDEAQENDIKMAAGTMYGGASDTTVSTLTSFVLAMFLFPETQKKAQQEIDSVLGSAKLPGCEDRPRLPYVEALVKETFRWLPVVPMCVPHVTTEDIIYGGYLIPKGATILPNSRSILLDPANYANPSRFDPDRFLAPRNEQSPDEAFGYGRRACPGRYFAEDNLFLTISMLLAAFDITAPLDADGNKVEIKVQPTGGLISWPENFQYSIQPRSERHAELIRSLRAGQTWEESDAALAEFDRRVLG